MSNLPAILQRTSKIVMLHMNFRSRAEEQGDFPALPTYHLKAPSTLASNGDVIRRPPTTRTLLAEGEIAVVIGKPARRVSLDEAWDHVGYVAPANDVTVLDFSWAESPAMLRAKGWDGSTPIGPLVDARDVDPEKLHLRLTVNGEVRQEATSDSLIFPLARLVSELSDVMTLLPGDVILSGTPARARPVEIGDRVVVELVGLSRLENTVAQDGAALSTLMPPARVIPRVRAAAMGVAAHRDELLGRAEFDALAAMKLDRLCAAARRYGHYLVPLEGIMPAVGAGPLAGYVYALRQVPSRGDALAPSGKRLVEALSALGEDEVIVAEGTFSLDGHAELADRLRARKLAGVVMAGGPDGSVRDLPVYSLSGGEPRAMTPVLSNTPINLSGQLVIPGDIVVAGPWGAAVMPSAIAAAIARGSAVA